MVINKGQWLSFSVGLISGPLLMYYCCAFGPASGHSKVLQEAVSPDGKYVASVVAWSQGPLGCHRDWVTIDRVTDGAANSRSSGNVVYAHEDSYGESIAWKSANKLLITYQLTAGGINIPKYVTQSYSTKYGNVTIDYAIAEPPQEEMQQHGR